MTEALPIDRRQRRRAETIEQVLEVAVEVMGEQGVAGLTLGEVARRMGIRPPSLYVYFDGKHALYDALFERGWRLLQEHLQVAEAALDGADPVADLHSSARAFVRWAVEHPAYSALMFWRPVPGFEPSPESYEISVRDMEFAREEFAEAVRLGQLAPEAATDDALRLYTVVLSGVISQQLANEPGVSYEDGAFSRLTETAIDLFLSAYRP